MLKVDARVRGGCRAVGRACTGVRMCLPFRGVALPMVGLAQESLQTWRNWQRNEFRCSFGECIGNEMSFGAVCAVAIQVNVGFTWIFRCKNNEKTGLTPLF